jgi:hypothetical protein
MTSPVVLPANRRCFREPIPEIHDVVRFLDAAVSAHLAGEQKMASRLIMLADMAVIREWLDSVWGAKSPYTLYRPIVDAPPFVGKHGKASTRMPDTTIKRQLIERDGYHCRLCGIPVIREEVRKYLRMRYPEALRWGARNVDQHAGFQVLWLQYDHVLPHARGGSSSLENMVVACAACNYGRMQYTLEEVGFAPIVSLKPVRSSWDGLERVLSRPMTRQRG